MRCAWCDRECGGWPVEGVDGRVMCLTCSKWRGVEDAAALDRDFNGSSGWEWTQMAFQCDAAGRDDLAVFCREQAEVSYEYEDAEAELTPEECDDLDAALAAYQRQLDGDA